jgi:hypothetical protein
MKKGLITILMFMLYGHLIDMLAQDTIRYIGKLDGLLLYESIELYPDSSFKWTSEYDLSWSEYGKYTLCDNKLILIFNESDKTKIRSYSIENDKMYLIDDNNQIINKIEDKSVRIKRRLFNSYKHDYYFIQE